MLTPWLATVAMAAPRTPHVEPEDEDGVQHNVAYRTDDGGQHAEFGKALGGHKGVHAHDQQYEQAAQHIDAGVGQSVGQGDAAGAEPGQQLRGGGVKTDGQHHGQPHQYRETVAYDALGLAVVLLAHGDGGTGGAAGADEHGKGVQKHQDGGKQAHAGQSRCADPRDVSDVNAVHDVVQQVDHLRHHGGDHELGQELFHVTRAHILLFFLRLCHGKCLLWFERDGEGFPQNVRPKFIS